jgi:hypothetical protein
MKTGRPPAWVLDPSSPGPVLQEARLVQSRGRVSVPARLLAGLPGVNDSSGGEFLLVLEEPGRVRLLPWAPHGEEALERRRGIAGGDVKAAGTLEALRAWDDKYRRLRIDGGRIDLPLAVVAHLDSRFRIHGVHLVRYPGTLEIWSAAYRNRRLRDMEELGADDGEPPW